MNEKLIISSKMILGVYNGVKIIKKNEFGFIVQTGDKSQSLFPNRYIHKSMKIGDIIEVFIYTDSKDRIVATTETPLAKLGEFALLEVVDTTKFGAFVNWGITKDLLVPHSAQERPYKIGQKHIIRITFDNVTHRLIGVGKTKPFISQDLCKLCINMEVTIIIMNETPLGFKVLVNNRYNGMIFHNEIFSKINYGDIKQAFIKKIRSDGKLDISLQAIGNKRVTDDTTLILDYIIKCGGMMPFTSKSDAKLIKKNFGLSKKSYKKALNKLLKLNKISLNEDGCFII